jgi:hypothetical protein
MSTLKANRDAIKALTWLMFLCALAIIDIIILFGMVFVIAFAAMSTLLYVWRLFFS